MSLFLFVLAQPKTIRKGKTRQSLLMEQYVEASNCTASDTVFNNQALVQSTDDVPMGIFLIDCL